MRTISFEDLSISATVQISVPVDPLSSYFDSSLIIGGDDTGDLETPAHSGDEALRIAAERYAKDSSADPAVAFIKDARGGVVAVAVLHKVATFPCS